MYSLLILQHGISYGLMFTALEPSVNGFLEPTQLTLYPQFVCLDQPLKVYLANTSIVLGGNWTQ